MKLTIAYSAMLASSGMLAISDAFAPHAFGRGNHFSLSSSSSYPSRGNVSYKNKVRAWHNLYLEPWSGVQLSSAVDESVEQRALPRAARKWMANWWPAWWWPQADPA